ncbi:MAG TPA: molybdopterin oxidoreductase [Clostridiales bacterium]|nr:molybdopterin oxidoreductase [Clostridiales bacterium]
MTNRQDNTTTEIVCIVCPNGCRIRCTQTGSGIVYSGQKCKRGEAYTAAELTHPMRSLTTSVRTAFPDSPVVSVRTDGEIEKGKLIDVAKALGQVIVDQRVKIGDIIAENICGTGVNIICTSDRLVNPY